MAVDGDGGGCGTRRGGDGSGDHGDAPGGGRQDRAACGDGADGWGGVESHAGTVLTWLGARRAALRERARLARRGNGGMARAGGSAA
ncbi:hypothetical protein ACFPRL_23905 [Pseudoclavibacter helvolus]